MVSGERLVMDFVAAARQFAAGDHESTLEWLLSADQPVAYRLPKMLAVGALLSGTLSTVGGGPGPGGLVGELAAAGAELDGDAIQELITGRTGESIGLLVDVLTEFVVAVARWEASADPEAAKKSFQMVGELLPEPQFTHEIPAGRRLSTEAPGGQPAPLPPPGGGQRS